MYKTKFHLVFDSENLGHVPRRPENSYSLRTSSSMRKMLRHVKAQLTIPEILRFALVNLSDITKIKNIFLKSQKICITTF